MTDTLTPSEPAEAAEDLQPSDLLSKISVVSDGITHEIYAIMSRPTETWTDDDRVVIRFAVMALVRRRASIAALMSELEAQVALAEQRVARHELETTNV